MAVHASDVASVTDAAGVVRVSPVLVRLAQAEVERHHREGTEAPLGIIRSRRPAPSTTSRSSQTSLPPR